MNVAGRAVYYICFREADIPQTLRKKSFKLLPNTSADAEVLPEAIEKFDGDFRSEHSVAVGVRRFLKGEIFKLNS